MVLGYCPSCDLSFTDSIIKENTIKMIRDYPLAYCPRCGAISWLGADKQREFVQICKDREAGRTPIDDPVETEFDTLE